MVEADALLMTHVYVPMFDVPLGPVVLEQVTPVHVIIAVGVAPPAGPVTVAVKVTVVPLSTPDTATAGVYLAVTETVSVADVTAL